MESSNFKCPLCGSPLTKNNYYKIIGAWEEKSKLEKELKTKLASTEDAKKKLILEQQRIKKQLIEERVNLKKQFDDKFEKQRAGILKGAQEEAKKLAKKNIDKLNKEKLDLERKISEGKKNNKKQLIEEKAKIQKQFEEQRLMIFKKAKENANRLAKKDIDKLNKEKLELERKNKKEITMAKKEALEQGKTHEKKRTDRLSKMLNGNMEKLECANHIIKELKEQLKKGTTPQIEGLNLEEELVKELRSKFPEDRIERHGHGGDIHHYIAYKKEEIGFIIYECKKTKKFQKNYVHQIKNDVVKKNASYGVLITSAPEKNKAGFWVKDGILIVHPWGTIYIAEVLRKWIISLYSLNLDKRELNECAKKLLEYIKGDKFKNCVEDTIDRTRQLNGMLNKEVVTHRNIWEKRNKHYSCIFENSQSIEQDSNAIIQNERKEVKKIEEEIEEDPILVFERRRKKNG